MQSHFGATPARSGTPKPGGPGSFIARRAVTSVAASGYRPAASSVDSPIRSRVREDEDGDESDAATPRPRHARADPKETADARAALLRMVGEHPGPLSIEQVKAVRAILYPPDQFEEVDDDEPEAVPEDMLSELSKITAFPKTAGATRAMAGQEGLDNQPVGPARNLMYRGLQKKLAQRHALSESTQRSSHAGSGSSSASSSVRASQGPASAAISFVSDSKKRRVESTAPPQPRDAFDQMIAEVTAKSRPTASETKAGGRARRRILKPVTATLN
ncbi:hypothetical protein H9P43_001414 [Blastocladiella emersonii ATCC 22665]|nr:hypothetical protein H9P43_001414 [Blastocladiella emersonii ATCC 22665]